MVFLNLLLLHMDTVAVDYATAIYNPIALKKNDQNAKKLQLCACPLMPEEEKRLVDGDDDDDGVY